MDILIPDSWLRDFISTKATPKQLAEALSLCSLSVDRVETTADGDSLYHIEVPPNRYDCLSVLGVAREAAAALPRFGHEVRLTTPTILPPQFPKSPRLTLEPLIDTALCPRFSAVIIDSVTIKPSPETIRQRLEKVGIRPLNNLIDITNYLMIELGQPMHAFDFDKLTDKKMVLRESRPGERLMTLDGKTHDLPVNSIVIEDGKCLIDLCGIMGGENSGIDLNTKKVILFAQIYEPVHIRKTSMALPLRTEAAQRFEKGLDPEMVLPALFKSVELARSNAGAEVASALIDSDSQPFKPHEVIMTQAKLNQYLGVVLKPEEVTDILESLSLHTTFDHKLLTFKSLIPSWRDKDITIEEDLIEEVARIHGYHNLPTTLPVGELAGAQPEPIFPIENRIKVMLKDFGFTEVLNLSLTSKELAGNGELVRVLNPLGAETEYLIADPFPATVEVIKKNMARLPEIKIFETGNTHRPHAGDKPPTATDFLTIAMLSTRFSDVEKSFLEVKGLAETIFKEFSVDSYFFKDYSTFPYHYSMPLSDKTSFVIWAGKEIKSGKILGVGGQSSEISNLYLLKINLEALTELVNPGKIFQPLLDYPPITEEVSFYLPANKTYTQALEVIKSSGGELLKDAVLTDLYIDEELRQAGKRSLTFKLTFQSPLRTLTSPEVLPVREKIIKAIKDQLGAEPRVK